jgi:hypothetical protein
MIVLKVKKMYNPLTKLRKKEKTLKSEPLQLTPQKYKQSLRTTT